MPCRNCEKNPVIQLTGSKKSLCKSCFVKYFERKVKSTISKYNMVDKKDHLGVAVSGGKDSMTVLNILHDVFSKRRDIKLTALAIDEGIKEGRDGPLEGLRKFCKKKKIDLKVYSFKDIYDFTVDDVADRDIIPCTVCGVLRRNILNKAARELKFDKLATGHNMDDEAQTIIMNQLRRNVRVSARLGPVTGMVKDKKLIKRIKPLYFVSEKEVEVYSEIKGFDIYPCGCPYHHVSYRKAIKDMLNDFEDKYSGTKNNIINSFLEILPFLKKGFEGGTALKYCSVCGEPASKEECRTCGLLKEIKTSKKVKVRKKVKKSKKLCG